MVVAVVLDLVAPAIGRAAVKRRRHPEIAAGGPQRVIVVVAPQGQEVEALGAGVVGRTFDERTKHHRLQPELTDRIAHLGDRFFGGVARDHRGRGETRGMGPEGVGDVTVVRAARGDPQGGVADLRGEKAFAGIHDREVDAELLETRRVELRERGCCTIERVLRRPHPRARIGGRVRGVSGETELTLDRELPVRVDDRRAPDLVEVVEKHLGHLDRVAIGIDHRMAERGPYVACSARRHVRRVGPGPNRGPAATLAALERTRGGRVAARAALRPGSGLSRAPEPGPKPGVTGRPLRG